MVMDKEYGFHGYDRRLTYLLQRINPEKFGFVKRQPMKNVRVTPLILTPNNRETLSKYYIDLVNEGWTKPRIISLLDQTGRLLEWLNKDYSQVVEDDIKVLITRIRSTELSEYTKADYLVKLKRFDKWFNGGEEYSSLTKKIKTTVKRKDLKLPSQLITPEEATQLIEATTTLRNRVLLHLLWETGARVGEIANLKIKDLEFNQGECRLNLMGKTGSRRVLLLESVRDLQNYLKIRNSTSSDDYVFIHEGVRNKNKQITYGCIAQLIRKLMKKSKINKNIHAHLFRHSRATYLASKGLNEAQLCTIFGWVIGSKQTRTYIHLSGAQVENAYKSLYGIQKPDEHKQDLIKCPTCFEINLATNQTCQNCYNPLTIQGALKLKQEKDLIEHDRDISQKVFAEAFRLISQKNVSVEEAQKEAIRVVAQQDANLRLNQG
jgi:integrase/recombinase XerD